MLLAIDIGNTHTVFGAFVEGLWRTWRRATNIEVTEDELGPWLISILREEGLPMPDAIGVASVSPRANDAISRMARKWFRQDPWFVDPTHDYGVPVVYDPVRSVGADRIANAVAALDRYRAPIIVVDFGTATTFDSIDSDGVYVGGAILPGPEVATQALVGHTAKLPQFEFKRPEFAIGRTTVESLQSGVVLGYSGAIDALSARISEELGGNVTVIATGGLSHLFMGICGSLRHHEPDLTLEGIRLCWERQPG